jgi:hypothetical protein
LVPPIHAFCLLILYWSETSIRESCPQRSCSENLSVTMEETECLWGLFPNGRSFLHRKYSYLKEKLNLPMKIDFEISFVRPLLFRHISRHFKEIRLFYCFWGPIAPPPPVGQSPLIHEVSRSHTTMHHGL